VFCNGNSYLCNALYFSGVKRGRILVSFDAVNISIDDHVTNILVGKVWQNTMFA
jgi:hypothetical protein